MSDLLKDLTVVIEHFEGPATQDPVKDLVERGVDRAAIEEFMEECIITGLNSGLPIHEGWHMVALSCFHMGMLTQQYLRETASTPAKHDPIGLHGEGRPNAYAPSAPATQQDTT